MFLDWDKWRYSAEDATSDLKGIGPKSAGLLTIFLLWVLLTLIPRRNFLFLGCYRPTLRLQEQLQQSQQNLVLREQKMDFRHLRIA